MACSPCRRRRSSLNVLIYQMLDCRGVGTAHVFQIVNFERKKREKKSHFCTPFAYCMTPGGMRVYTAFLNSLYSIAPSSHGTLRMLLLLYSSCPSRVRSFHGLRGLNDKDTE